MRHSASKTPQPLLEHDPIFDKPPTLLSDYMQDIEYNFEAEPCESNNGFSFKQMDWDMGDFLAQFPLREFPMVFPPYKTPAASMPQKCQKF